VAFGVLFALVVAFGIALAVLSPTAAARWVFTAGYLGLELAAAVFVTLRASRVERERFAWGLMAAGLWALTAGDAVELLSVSSRNGQPNSVAGLVLYIMFFVCTFVALGTIAKARIPLARGRVWLDGLIAALGLLAVSSRFAMPHGDSPGAAEILSLLYIAAPLLFIAILAVILVSTDRRPGLGWWALLVASTLMTASNIATSGLASSTYTIGSPLDVLWPLATAFVALAAWAPPAVENQSEGRRRSRGIVFAPAFFAGLALIVLVDTVIGVPAALPEYLALLTLAVAIVLLLLSVRDAERLRKNEEQLNAHLQVARDEALDAASVKTDFLAWMSHEIRTPLTTVLGMNELLQDTELDETQRLYVNKVALSGSLLSEIITDILDFSKIEAGSVELEHRPIDLEKLVEASVAVIALSAETKGLTLVVDYRDECARYILGDATRLRQVLVNLLTNAVKFTSRGGVTLTVSRGRSPENMRFAVSDTGIGIEKGRIERLFEPFTQADASTSRRQGGTGLGLSICHGLVELLGGTIDVVSVPGEGSTFAFEIAPDVIPAPPVEPAVSAKVAGSPALVRKKIASSAAPLRVLVAEDDQALRLYTRTLVRKLGNIVDAVQDGQSALEALSTGNYDLALMDVHMPIMDGPEATRRLRLLGDSIVQPRVIAVTASATPRDHDACLEAGMNLYISKPFTAQDLRNAFAAVQGVPATGSPSPSRAGRFAALDELGEEIKSEVLHTFIDRGNEDVLALEAASLRSDSSEVRFIAHRLRGSSLVVGAGELAEACLEVESTDARAAVAPSLVVAVRSAWDSAREAIDVELHAHP
jgi:signal transduction histidine kinase/DNA-binding response OmpR family regulator